jgi:hypothetical protein
VGGAAMRQPFVQPHRRHVQTFEGVKEITNLFERSSSKTERTVYLLSDCILVRAMCACASLRLRTSDGVARLTSRAYWGADRGHLQEGQARVPVPVSLHQDEGQ